MYIAPRRWKLERLTTSVASYPVRIRDWWSVQTGTNRIVYGAIASALVLALVLFAALRFRGPDYAVLFSNLQPDEANAVVQKLDAEKVPHRLADGGATILVPHELVYEKRVELAGQGVVKAGGGTGFELFDRTNLGMTDFQEKIAKTRATEGELQRTISGLTPVQSARVHIASPAASLYSNTQQPTTASVAIATKSGMQLSAQEVRGITQLVSGAVEGLKPENVTIVDQNGTVLRAAARKQRRPLVRRRRRRRAEDSQRGLGRGRDRCDPRRPDLGRSDPVRAGSARPRRPRCGDDHDRVRTPDRPVRRADRDPRGRRRGLRARDAAPPHLPPELRAADLRLDARRRAALVRRASDARRDAVDRGADPLRRRPHPRADDRVRHHRRSREPRQHRQARETLVGRIT